MCYRCPRGTSHYHSPSPISLTCLHVVFHPQCYGVSKAKVARTPMMICTQHSCSMCFRSTGDAGGMLFRCVLRGVDASGIGLDLSQVPNVSTSLLRGLLTGR
jgi:hypothetical protein